MSIKPVDAKLAKNQDEDLEEQKMEEVVASPPPSPPGAAGAWADNLCDCCKDMCTCCAGMWCTPVTIAQLHSKTTGNRGAFCLVMIFLWILYIAQQGTQAWYQQLYQERLYWAMQLNWWGLVTDPQYFDGAYWAAMISSYLFQIILFVVTTVLICGARNRIKARDGIYEDGCSTCCISCCPCTSPCAICQMMRHEGMVGNYQLCDPEGGAKSAGPAV